MTARLAQMLRALAEVAGRTVAGDLNRDEEHEEDSEAGWLGPDGAFESPSRPVYGLRPEDEALAHELAGEAAETDDDREAEYLAGADPPEREARAAVAPEITDQNARARAPGYGGAHDGEANARRKAGPANHPAARSPYLGEANGSVPPQSQDGRESVAKEFGETPVVESKGDRSRRAVRLA